MKTKIHRLFILIVCVNLFILTARAEDLRKILSLSGYWRFSIGDDLKWADPSFDDSRWDQIIVPGPWENQGYNDYNGYAWYRKSFKMADIPANTSIYLVLGHIDDADVVFLNGREIGKSGKLPPDFVTAYNKDRKYALPAAYLKRNAENVIAVRVYDTFLGGGIIDGPAGLYSDEDNNLLNVSLNGKWKFHPGDNKDWKMPDYNDKDWKWINVPAEWENEGYDGYDGYAWYRIQFSLPMNFATGNLYLSLGKIDDIDDAYLNGKLIGNVYNLKKDAEYKHTGWEYNARRLYKIPDGLLNKNGKNTLAIRVYDGQLRGGIYEGPIGIMSADNYRKYRNKHYTNQSFWDYWYDLFYENDSEK
jgi:hypothetical protein